MFWQGLLVAFVTGKTNIATHMKKMSPNHFSTGFLILSLIIDRHPLLVVSLRVGGNAVKRDMKGSRWKWQMESTRVVIARRRRLGFRDRANREWFSPELFHSSRFPDQRRIRQKLVVSCCHSCVLSLSYLLTTYYTLPHIELFSLGLPKLVQTTGRRHVKSPPMICESS